VDLDNSPRPPREVLAYYAAGRRTSGSSERKANSNVVAPRSCSFGTYRPLQRSCWTSAEAPAGTRHGSPRAVTPCTWSIPCRCITTRRGHVQPPSRMLHSQASAKAMHDDWTGQPSRSMRSSCSDRCTTCQSVAIESAPSMKRVVSCDQTGSCWRRRSLDSPRPWTGWQGTSSVTRVTLRSPGKI